MKWIVRLTFILMAIAACISFIFVRELKPASGSAFLFIAAWLVLPYAIMSAALIAFRRKQYTPVNWHVVAALVSIGGTVFLADVIFWHPDAQGAIAVFMTPFPQAGAIALLLHVASWVSRHVRR